MVREGGKKEHFFIIIYNCIMGIVLFASLFESVMMGIVLFSLLFESVE